ncbi:SRPBCC family protein [Actinokineospora terrae]|uniref:Polyketide cyclase / dehydrase and lipid transport n=1 Tax=Actinokineospora terrae TaxID=155974 RepID=A0A1H9TN76_9PSEU|nr:SRPBCC family protein [Actinokineospora terrae]SER98454.1 hypothetical protein SAMN04487818_106370 [Actinokineospora terrae]
MIFNRHQRALQAPPAEAAHLLDDLALPDTATWPREHWPALRLDRPLSPGATGGHGPIHYTCTDYIPGHRAEFTFTPDAPVRGGHALTLLTGPTPATSVLRHDLYGHPQGLGHLTWPLIFRWLHDALMEDLLDNVERALGTPPAHPAHWTPWVQTLRRLR